MSQFKTTEIVDWLRNAPSNEWCGPMLDKAADEIERLREALRECHAWVPGDDEATVASILFKKALPNG